jgi:leucyl-tRNA synthetase
MSKRWGNVVNPTDVIAEYGADSFRLYEMFIGPFTQSASWKTSGVEGVFKFLQRYGRLYQKELTDDLIEDQERLIHKAIKKVGEDITAFQFNTAISEMMIVVNALTKAEIISRSVLERLNRILAPFAVHMTEELHQTVFGREGSVHHAEWPTYDESKLVSDTVKLAVQVNGKVRAQIEVAADAAEADIKALALEQGPVQKWLDGQEPKKVIYVKGRLVSVVV